MFTLSCSNLRYIVTSSDVNKMSGSSIINTLLFTLKLYHFLYLYKRKMLIVLQLDTTDLFFVIFAIHPPPSYRGNHRWINIVNHNIDVGVFLLEYVKYFRNSDILKEVMGNHLFSKYIEAKEKEWKEYHTTVSKYELNKYLGR